MSEPGENIEPRQGIRNVNHVLLLPQKLEGLRKVGGIKIDKVLRAGTSGWLLNGKTPEGFPTIVKLAMDPIHLRDTGPHFEHNAQILEKASKRTPFAPLFFGNGLTTVPGQEGMFPYIAMEYIPGKSLKEIMSSQSLDTDTSLSILKTIAFGVDALLGNGSEEAIISADLKPQNIILRENNRPVLIDFDLALIEGETNGITQADWNNGVIRGTASYAGPEMAAVDKEITRELNSWQLGAIAFEMLTHEIFFKVEHKARILFLSHSKERFNEFLNQRLDESNLNPATREVLAKALAYDPMDRYHSATEFIYALDKAVRTSGEKGHRLINRSIRRIKPGKSHEHKDTTRPYNGRHVKRGRHRISSPRSIKN